MNNERIFKRNQSKVELEPGANWAVVILVERELSKTDLMNKTQRINEREMLFHGLCRGS